VARTGLKALDRTKAVCVTGIQNKAVVELERLLPRVMVRKTAARVTKRF